MASGSGDEKSLAMRLVEGLLKDGEPEPGNRVENGKKGRVQNLKVTMRPEELMTDILSSLPESCIHEIFKNLTKRDLYNVLEAFKGMLSTQMKRSFTVGMIYEGGALTILKTEIGYGFQLTVPENPLRLSFPFCFTYDICKSEDGSLVEKSWRNYTGITKELRKSLTNQPHDWAIPGKLFTALSVALRRVTVKTVRFDQIPLSTESLSSLQSVLGEHDIEIFVCSEVTVEQPIAEIQKSFAEFFGKIKSVTLKKSPQLSVLVNEKFIRTLGESKLTDFMCDAAPDRLEAKHIFRPDKSILPLIERFNTLETVGMVLDANWIVPMIMSHLNKAKKTAQTGGWKFAVDQPIDSWIIHMALGGSSFECHFGNQFFEIARKSRRTAAVLRNAKCSQLDGTSRHIVTVLFAPKRANSKFG